MTAAEDREQERSRLAHDLNTPLAVIIGYGELIGSRDDEGSRLEASRMIVDAAERLSREIDALLDRFLPRL